jgi:hypothetical protein
LVVAGIVLLCTVGVCAAGAVIVPQLGEVAGCRTNQAPEASGVQDDPKRVKEILPALGEVTRAHWRWREARPHTCPELGPMDLFYEGFAALPPDRAAAVQAEHPWEPAGAPEVPAELAGYAPPGPAWRRSAAFDTATRATIWLDPGSGTVYFSYLRG